MIPRAEHSTDAGSVNAAETLRRLHILPPQALLTPNEAALYLNARLDLLRAWRCQGRGPVFQGRGHFVRYTRAALDAFLGREGRSSAA